VLFAGIGSPQAATGATAALLTFVLPVAVAEPAAAVGPRLLGWAIAGAFCLPACLFVWAPSWHDDLRRQLSTTIWVISRLAEAHAEARLDPHLHAELSLELSRLRNQFAGTP
jgi:hypothetical protein